MGMRVIGGAIPSVSYRTTAAVSASGSSFTFTSQDIGTASAKRYVVCAYRGTGIVSSVTIGGVTATALSTFGPNFYIAAVPTGTTANVVVNVTVNTSHVITIALWAVYNISSPAAQAVTTSTASPAALSLNVPSRGIVIAEACGGNNSGGTWSGATEDFDQTSSVNDIPRTGASIAATTPGAPRTVTCTYGGVPASPRAVSISLR
jgi:hypothetical protein